MTKVEEHSHGTVKMDGLVDGHSHNEGNADHSKCRKLSEYTHKLNIRQRQRERERVTFSSLEMFLSREMGSITHRVTMSFNI